jgi:hypothetical protein
MIYECLAERQHTLPPFPIPNPWPWHLGLDFGVADTRLEIRTGEELFAEAHKATQRAVLGAGGFRAYREGRASLRDFVGVKHLEKCGSMRVTRPLKEVQRGERLQLLPRSKRSKYTSSVSDDPCHG